MLVRKVMMLELWRKVKGEGCKLTHSRDITCDVTHDFGLTHHGRSSNPSAEADGDGSTLHTFLGR